MKNTILLFLFLLPITGFCQICEDFTDGNYTNNWVWTGDSGMFNVDTSFHLQLYGLNDDVPINCISVISTPNNIMDSCWVFWSRINLNSNQWNNARVYLVSDTNNLRATLHGYYVQLGGSDDKIALVRQDDTIATKIIIGTKLLLHHINNIFTVKVTRSCSGAWSLYSDSLAGSNFLLEGTTVDFTYNSTSSFGIYINYLSNYGTCSAFYFDDFCFYPDTCNGVGIENNINEINLFIFPNPTTTNLFVEYYQPATLYLYNMQGQQLMLQKLKETKTEIDISSLAAGLYFLKLESKEEVAVRRFIKE